MSVQESAQQLDPQRASMPGVVRGMAALPAGQIVWMVIFSALAFGLAALWPAYRVPGRTYFEQQVFTFTPAMAVCNLLFWFGAALAAGFIAMRIAKRPAAVWVLAVLLVGYLASMHLVLYWDRFPWWYNLGVVLPAVPAVRLGAVLAGARRRLH